VGSTSYKVGYFEREDGSTTPRDGTDEVSYLGVSYVVVDAEGDDEAGI
jgi:hypothetical protein